MYDLVIVGSGIGALGLIGKIKDDYKNKKICIISKREANRYKFFDRKGNSYEYLLRENLGNVHDWGGVLTLSNYALNNYSSDFYQKSLQSYFSESPKLSIDSKLTSTLLVDELKPYQIDKDIKHRKLLISDRKLLLNTFDARLKKLDTTRLSANVDSFKKNGEHYEILTEDGIKICSRRIALCSGAIGTRKILENSGLVDQKDFEATDSKFGRIGRIRFDTPLPFGFFHHHLISKTIRFKTGFEINGEKDSMFFLQPAIKGIPASDIHLLKEFLTLKTEFTFKNILKFISKPRSIIQILLMEFSIMNKTTDFDVYCISDFGKCLINENNQGYEIDTRNFNSIVKNNYKTFLHYINSKQNAQCLDHKPDEPLLDNLESALHMCGTVGYNMDFKFDSKTRIYEILDDIIVNDNSIIIDKGIANPSIQLF